MVFLMACSKYILIHSLQFNVYVLPTYDLVSSDFTEGLSNSVHQSAPVVISTGLARYNLSSSRTAAQCTRAGDARPKRAVRHPGIILRTKLIFEDFFDEVFVARFAQRGQFYIIMYSNNMDASGLSGFGTLVILTLSSFTSHARPRSLAATSTSLILVA